MHPLLVNTLPRLHKQHPTKPKVKTEKMLLKRCLQFPALTKRSSRYLITSSSSLSSPSSSPFHHPLFFITITIPSFFTIYPITITTTMNEQERILTDLPTDQKPGLPASATAAQIDGKVTRGRKSTLVTPEPGMCTPSPAKVVFCLFLLSLLSPLASDRPYFLRRGSIVVFAASSMVRRSSFGSFLPFLPLLGFVWPYFFTPRFNCLFCGLLHDLPLRRLSIGVFACSLMVSN